VPQIPADISLFLLKVNSKFFKLAIEVLDVFETERLLLLFFYGFLGFLEHLPLAIIELSDLFYGLALEFEFNFASFSKNTGFK